MVLHVAAAVHVQMYQQQATLPSMVPCCLSFLVQLMWLSRPMWLLLKYLYRGRKKFLLKVFFFTVRGSLFFFYWRCFLLWEGACCFSIKGVLVYWEREPGFFLLKVFWNGKEVATFDWTETWYELHMDMVGLVRMDEVCTYSTLMPQATAWLFYFYFR